LLEFVGPQHGDGFMPVLLRGLRALAEAPGLWTGPAALSLAQTELGEDGVRLLVAGLAATGVRHLALLEADLYDAGAVHVARALREGAAVLHTLTLRATLLGDDGATALAGALGAGGCALRSLTLADGSIGPAGAKALAAAVRGGGSRLVRLCLHENTIGDVGALALAAAIRTPGAATLRTLDVSNNEIRMSVEAATTHQPALLYFMFYLYT
jgi:hypothetical protein